MPWDLHLEALNILQLRSFNINMLTYEVKEMIHGHHLLR